jgi:DNA-binding winged helix-turn-helix (wHTH) protein
MFAQYAGAEKCCTELELLTVCAFCADGELFPTTVTQREATDQFYPRLLRARHGSLIYALPEVLRNMLAPDGGFSNMGMCALKKIFVADAWISNSSTSEIEEQYRTFAGTFANLGAHFSWLAQALAACMATLGCEDAQVQQVAEFAERLAWGCSAAGLEIARLGVAGVARTHVQQLVRAGYDRLDAFIESEPEQLVEIIPLRCAHELIARAKRICTTRECVDSQSWFEILDEWNRAKHQADSPHGMTEAQHPARDHDSTARTHVPVAAEAASDYLVQWPELILDPKHPGEIHLRGQQLRLTPKPFELLCLLARSAGSIVSYADIDSALWPDCKVEAQQRSAHKVRLVGALAQVIGKEAAEKMLENVPRFGMRLNVAEEKIRFGKIRLARARTETGAAYLAAR